ncbi:hypothetical protein FACS1894170_07350 [Planctomycetales bacterium]|nr:hypothetical protein FACS1894170_07350 [Planctomycetales bacterium]
MFARVFSQGARLDMSLIFLGVSLLLFAVAPNIPVVRADDNCGCPDGMVCVAIGESYECQCPTE